ncbi:hypothetical protein PoB_007064800 [Plakobranchus ocellatus]|uniref:Uncharacterized protein n=1 Tax=Plakobranchus ocellatus TaxID=259542 RepID=A0AAV4DIU3_9GAST|nr:hypothetical protein PoB_007064800 [Plakobranchus ocellatus]
MAAARNTLESLWRPPKTLWSLYDGRQRYFSLSGGRRIDSVYAKTTLAQEKITVNRKTIIPYIYCLWRLEMAFTFDEFEAFFQRKIYSSL